MELKKLTEQAALHLMKSGTFGEKRFVLMEMPEGTHVTFEVGKDGTGAIFGIDTETCPTIVETMNARMLEMSNDVDKVVREQVEACQRMAADGVEGNMPDFTNVATLTIHGIVYGGHYEAEGIISHVGEDLPVPSESQYTQMVTFSAYAMEVNGNPVDFYTMAALCMSYGIPVLPALMYGDFTHCLSFRSMITVKDTNSFIPAMAPLLDGECEPILKDGQLQALPFKEGNKMFGFILRETAETDTGYAV